MDRDQAHGPKRDDHRLGSDIEKKAVLTQSGHRGAVDLEPFVARPDRERDKGIGFQHEKEFFDHGPGYCSLAILRFIKAIYLVYKARLWIRHLWLST